jgi:hypothetical protein
MEKKVKSEFNVGTVVAEDPKKGTVTVLWKGFNLPIEIPNVGLEVVNAE